MFQFPTDAAPVSLETIPTMIDMTAILFKSQGRVTGQSLIWDPRVHLLDKCLLHVVYVYLYLRFVLVQKLVVPPKPPALLQKQGHLRMVRG